MFFDTLKLWLYFLFYKKQLINENLLCKEKKISSKIEKKTKKKKTRGTVFQFISFGRSLLMLWRFTKFVHRITILLFYKSNYLSSPNQLSSKSIRSNSSCSSCVISNDFPPNICLNLEVCFGTMILSLSENSLN